MFMKPKDSLHSFYIEHRELVGEPRSSQKLEGNIGNYVLWQFKNAPNFIGQVDSESGRKVTFQEMQENSIRCALVFQDMLIEKGDVVVVCLPNIMDCYIPYLATLYIGAIVDLWHVDFLKKFLKFSNYIIRKIPKIVITTHEYEKAFIVYCIALKMIIPIICIDRYAFGGTFRLHDMMRKISQERVDKFICTNVDTMTPAVMMLSPTTANKMNCVVFPHMMFTCSNRYIPTMRNNKIVMWYTHLYSVHGPFLLMHAILEKLTVITPPNGRFTEWSMCDIIQKYKVNWLFLDGVMCNVMNDFVIDRYNYEFSSLKSIVCDVNIRYHGRQTLAKIFPNSIPIIVVYGMVETGMIAYYEASDQFQKYIGNGFVARNMKIMIVDVDSRRILSSDRSGEVWCKAPYMLEMNRQSPYDEIIKSQTQDMQAIDQERSNEGWFYTGDFGYYDNKGCLFVIDKVEHIKRYKKYLYYPRDMEVKVERHPYVRSAYAMIYLVRSIYVATILIETWAEISDEKLLYYMEKRIRLGISLDIRHKMFQIVGDVPRLPNGMIDRMQLLLNNPELRFKNR